MVFVREGGGGDEDDGGGDVGDELLGTAHRRCSVCRRELLPWEDVCPEDGGTAVAPGQLDAGDHDALLARLLAEDEDEDAATGDDGEAGAGADGAGGDGGGGGPDEPSWPSS